MKELMNINVTGTGEQKCSCRGKKAIRSRKQITITTHTTHTTQAIAKKKKEKNSQNENRKGEGTKGREGKGRKREAAQQECATTVWNNKRMPYPTATS